MSHLRPFAILGMVFLLACGGGGSKEPSTMLPPTATVLFTAGDTARGVQLWATDGTPQGTHLLKVINPQGWAFPNSLSTTFVSFNGACYFPAQTPENGYELWRTDGTAEGTRLVLDALPGPATGILQSPLQPLVIGSALYFKAYGNEYSNSYLWSLGPDGSPAQRLLDGYQGTDWDGQAYGMAPWGNGLVFQSPTSAMDWKIWFTDGTSAGTRPLASGTLPSGGLSVNGDQAIFLASPAGGSVPSASGLWACELRTSIQQLLIPMAALDVTPHWDAMVGARFNGGYALIEAHESVAPDTYGLWRTDGTPAGTLRLMDLSRPSGLTAQARGFQGRTYFMADDGIHGPELWVTDGTRAGTHLLMDLAPGSEGSYPGLSASMFFPTGGFFEFKGKLYFGAGGPNVENHVLWVSDGTPDGTRRVVALPDADSRVPKLPAAYCVVGDTLYFSAMTQGNTPSSRQLWRTDGTPEGTRQVTTFDFGDYSNPIWTIVPSPRP